MELDVFIVQIVGTLLKNILYIFFNLMSFFIRFRLIKYNLNICINVYFIIFLPWRKITIVEKLF
jgi:hypothetical protein